VHLCIKEIHHGERRWMIHESEPNRVPLSEAVLDAAVECTFPASDPISVDHAFHAAREREGDADAPRRAGHDERAPWPSSPSA
jgi:hypothetical protein